MAESVPDNYYIRDPKKMGKKRKLRIYEQLTYNDLVEVYHMQNYNELIQTNGVISEKFQDPANKSLFFCVIEQNNESRAITFELSEVWSLKVIHDWQDLASSSDEESGDSADKTDKSGYNASTEAQVGSQSTPNSEYRLSHTVSPSLISPIKARAPSPIVESEKPKNRPVEFKLGPQGDDLATDPFFTAQDTWRGQTQYSWFDGPDEKRESPILATQNQYLKPGKPQTFAMADLYHEDTQRPPQGVKKDTPASKECNENDIVDLIDKALSPHYTASMQSVSNVEESTSYTGSEKDSSTEFTAIPVLPNGNLDIFQIRVQYGIEKKGDESFRQYRERKHINAYMASRNVVEDTPVIWKFLNFLIPGITASLYNNWSTLFAQHRLPFPDWYDVYGRYTLVTVGSENQQDVNSIVNKVKAEVMEEANDYIQSMAEPMKNRLVQIFGTWSYGLGSEHFCSFKEFAASDVRLKQIQDAYVPSDTEHSDDESNNDHESSQYDNSSLRAHKQKVTEDGATYIPETEWEVESTIEDLIEWATPITYQTRIYSESVALGDEQNHAIQLDRYTFPVKQDFLPGGRYCHLYIPAYLHVPAMILEDLFGNRFVSHAERTIMWNRLRDARKLAAEELAQHQDPWRNAPEGCTNPNPQLDTLWLQYARQPDPKGVWSRNIDVVQHVYAHQWCLSHTETDDYAYRTDLYDIMIRPIERLFGVDMKLSRSLLAATMDCEKQSWVKRKILKITGITYPTFLKTNYCLSRLSEIRNLPGMMLSKINLTNIPPLAVSPMLAFTKDSFKYSEDATWKRVSPTADDFYPNGRLHGFFVHPSIPLPPWVVKKFYRRPPTELEEERLCTEIVLARAEWARKVQKQLILQCGPKSYKYPLSNRLPDWAYHAYELPFVTLQKVKSLLPVEASQLDKMDLLPHQQVIERYMANTPATVTNIPPDLPRQLGIVPADKAAWTILAHKLNIARGLPDPEEAFTFSQREKKLILRLVRSAQEATERSITGPLTAKSERHLEEIEKSMRTISSLLQKGTKNEISFPALSLKDLQIKRDINDKVEDVFSSTVMFSKNLRNIIVLGINQVEQTEPVNPNNSLEKSQIYDDHIKEMLNAAKPCPTFAQMLIKPRNVRPTGQTGATLNPQPVPRMITKSASDKQIAKARGLAIRALSPPITLPRGYVPKYYPKPGDPEFNPEANKRKHMLPAHERDSLLQVKAENKERVKRRLTFFPDQDRDRPKRSGKTSPKLRQMQNNSTLSPPTIATTPKRCRGEIVNQTISEPSILCQSLPQVENDSPPTYLQNHADRMRRVATRPFQSPPRPFQAREPEPQPTPPMSPPPNPPPSNVFMWNGARTFIPDWAKTPMSAWQVGRNPLLQVPLEQAPRLQMAHAMRRVPMDGVNRVEDIIIREGRDGGDRTILVQATTKPRGISPSQADNRSLHIPLHAVPILLQMLETAEKAVLPPAEKDFYLDEPTLYSTHNVIGRYNYIVEIRSITEMQGDERLTRIYREDNRGQDHGGIVFPWMFTTLFNAKIRNVHKEICESPNSSSTSDPSSQQ